MIVWCKHHCTINKRKWQFMGDWAKACSKWVWQMIENDPGGGLTYIHQAWLDGRCRATFCSLMSVWQHLDCVTGMHLLLSLKLLFLRGFCGPFTLCTPPCCIMSCTLRDGQRCTLGADMPVNMPSTCHTQLPSYSVPPSRWVVIVLVFPPSLKTPGVEWLQPHPGGNVRASWKQCNPKAILASQLWHGSCPFHTVKRSMHGTALMTAQGPSSSLGPLPLIHMDGFSSA